MKSEILIHEIKRIMIMNFPKNSQGLSFQTLDEKKIYFYEIQSGPFKVPVKIQKT